MPMSKAASARVARRIATAAAYGSGGLGLLGGATVGLLFTEVQLAKRKVGGTVGDPPPSDGRYGTAFAERATSLRPLRLAFLGDSTAAGLGVRLARQTPGGRLASALAAVAERPVELRNVALSGAQSDDLERQVSMVLAAEDPALLPDVAVLIIGANDVTHRTPPARSVRHLSDAVARLRTAGCEVVVGTCPDLGTIEPVGQPLRWVARRLSRQLAAAQTIAVVEEGGRTVSLSDLLGPEFAANPHELFGPDNYHPSAEGYATAAMAVLPTLCASLGLWPTEDEHPVAARREGILPVARAAAEAAAEGGTEVAGVRGPWALLKHRRRRRLPPPEDVGVEHAHAPDETAATAAEPTPGSPTRPDIEEGQRTGDTFDASPPDADPRGVDARGVAPHGADPDDMDPYDADLLDAERRTAEQRPTEERAAERQSAESPPETRHGPRRPLLRRSTQPGGEEHGDAEHGGAEHRRERGEAHEGPPDEAGAVDETRDDANTRSPRKG